MAKGMNEEAVRRNILALEATLKLQDKFIRKLKIDNAEIRASHQMLLNKVHTLENRLNGLIAGSYGSGPTVREPVQNKTPAPRSP